MINPQVTCWTFFQELREELQRLKNQTTPNHQVSDLKFIAKFLGLPYFFFAQWPWPWVNYIILLDFQINYPVFFMCAYGAFKQKHTAYSRGLSVLLWWLTGNVVWRWLIFPSGCCTLSKFGSHLSESPHLHCGIRLHQNKMENWISELWLSINFIANYSWVFSVCLLYLNIANNLKQVLKISSILLRIFCIWHC